MSILIMGNPEYPAWRHNKAGESKIVYSKADDRKLGKSWADSPAAFDLADVPEDDQEQPEPTPALTEESDG